MKRRTLAILLGLGLLAVFAADVKRSSLWTTSDEPLHLLAARQMKSGPGLVSNFEHPVGMKLLAAWGLPDETGRTLLAETQAGRKAFPWLFGVLVLSAGLLAARLAGEAVGIAAALFLTLDPSLRAHGAIVQTDVPMTAILMASAALLVLVRRPYVAAALAGAVYGLAAATKFSALPFLPVFLVAAAIPLLLERRFAHVLKRSAVFVALAAVALVAAQRIAYADTHPDRIRAAAVEQLEAWGQADRIPRVEARFASLPPSIAAYSAGLELVDAAAGPGIRFNYLFGKLSAKGFRSYFTVALLVKLLAATVLLLVASLAVAVFALRPGPGARRRRVLLAKRALFPAVVAAGYLGAASLTSLNIGVRHAFPVFAFALVAALGVLSTTFRPRLRQRILAAVLALSAVEAVAYAGREIPFGNVFAGGPSGLRRVLSDSNVDWGQDQARVFDRVRKGDLGRVGVASVFVDEAEAIRAGIVARPDGPGMDLDAVIVSVHLVDVAAALRANHDDVERFTWMKGWLVPMMDELEKRKTRVEPLGDCYVVYVLK